MAQSTTARSALSAYEATTLRDALARAVGTLDPVPEGKVIEAIVLMPLDVVEPRDPAPAFLNAVHVTTRKERILEDVLLRVGGRWQQYLVDESVRVLRGYQQVSLVLAVAMQGADAEHVKLLVVTKDTWSLRTQLELKVGSNGLDLLRLEPTERNIGGTLNSALGRFELYPENLNLGGAVYVPRIANRTYFVMETTLSVDRHTGDLEGTFGNMSLFRPLLSSDQRWGWELDNRWSNVKVRRYVGAQLATFDSRATPDDDAIPDVYRSRSLVETFAVTRSFGSAHKLDVQIGAELNVRRGVGLDPTRYAPTIVADYAAKRVPLSNDRAGPYVQARAYESRFVRLHDVDVLGLAEDFRLGYDTFVRAYPVVLGSTQLVGVDSFAQYVIPIGNGFARVAGEVAIEVRPDAVPTEGFAGAFTLVSPTLPFGRFFIDGFALARARNALNVRSSLGGEGRLRGYASAAFLGENLVAFNTEFRTKPVEVFACQVGGAVFHDLGDAFDGKDIRPKSSVGFGLRTAFPQLDRRVWRVDVAFPVTRSFRAPVSFYLSFEQAFPSQLVASSGPGATAGLLTPKGGALGQ